MVAWFAILSMLSLVFMPVGGAGPIPSVFETNLSGASIAICSGDGIRAIRFGPDGQPQPTAPEHHNHCPFCFAHAGFSLPAPWAPPPQVPSGSGTALPLPRAVPVVEPREFLTVLRSRAPPVANA
ncbi:MAG: DUF2946 domain-containing protein [Azospirillum sp.]|nr:DUF2946 domain-containing protein [Azospirillum sp.]